MNTIIDWFKSIFSDNSTIGGVVGGFLSALLTFIFGEVLWKSHVSKTERLQTLKKEQLNYLYAPLYEFYKIAYCKFDNWKSQNQNSVLARQPFFDSINEYQFVSQILDKYSGFSSQEIISSWAVFISCDIDNDKIIKRNRFLNEIIYRYNYLHKCLKLGYSKSEIKTKVFNIE